MAGAADAALQQEAAGRALLPETLHADFDRILLAFRQTEAGKDDDARATLQGIGLRSPFLEWKLLLRGLQAYYANDDARALENWQRLAPDRLPARLAAPFRFRIDAEFRAAQTPETQAALQQQLDRLEVGESLPPKLRKLRRLLTNQETLAAAFRQAEALLPALRREAPHLEARLASCFYWAALDTGPDDVPALYARVRPARRRPELFSPGSPGATNGPTTRKKPISTGKRLKKRSPPIRRRGRRDRPSASRALIWLRMGRNAAGIPDEKEIAKLPALSAQPSRPAAAAEPVGRAMFSPRSGIGA